jgi:hemolysin activation/secretion protein
MRLLTRGRIEGAFTDRADTVGTTGYGRVIVDGTLSHHLGGFDVGLTAAAGTSVGDLPVQRAFYIGGLQTVRGQIARPTGAGRVGDSFWLGRVETGPRWLALRPLVFYDVGWAGSRTSFTSPGRPLSGAGIGLTLLDGLVRFDAARGISPERAWRWDVSLGSRF